MKKFISILFLACTYSSKAQFEQGTIVPDFLRTDTFRVMTQTTGDFVSSTLFGDVDHNVYDLLVASIKFTDEDEAIKVSFAPGKIFQFVPKNNILYKIKDNFRIQANQSNNYLTLGASVGYDSEKSIEKRLELLNTHFGDINMNDILAVNNARTNYIKDINKFAWKLSLGYNEKLFAQVFSKKTDTTGKEEKDSLNYYATKARTISINGSVGLWNNFVTLGLGYYLMNNRQSAVKKQELIPYSGFSANLNIRAIKFQSKYRLNRNKDYVQSGFIPAIYLGVTYETQSTNVSTADYMFIENGDKVKSVVTPNLDLCITSKAQFRIGLPFTTVTKVNSEKAVLIGTVVQYSFKITNLN